MNQSYVVYCALTGEILKCVQCSPDAIKLQTGEHDGYIEGVIDSDNYWVEGNKLSLRPTLSIRQEGSVLKGVPKGATLDIDGDTYSCDGTNVHLSFGLPGEYTIKVIKWPYLPWSTKYAHTP